MIVSSKDVYSQLVKAELPGSLHHFLSVFPQFVSSLVSPALPVPSVFGKMRNCTYKTNASLC